MSLDIKKYMAHSLTMLQNLQSQMGSHTHPLVTSSAAGFMSTTDKNYLDSISPIITIDSTGKGVTHHSWLTSLDNSATGLSAFAIGVDCHASGSQSIAAGYSSIASGENSFVFGEGLNISAKNSMAIGAFNNSLNTENIFVIGDGTDLTNTYDLLSINKSGYIDLNVKDYANGQARFRLGVQGTPWLSLHIGTGGSNHGIYSDKLNQWMIYSDINGVTSINQAAVTISGNNTTNARLACRSFSSPDNAYREVWVGNMTNRAKSLNSGLTTSSTQQQWLDAIIKALCRDYPGHTHTVFKGFCTPSSQAYFKIDIYSTSTVNSAYIPQYAYGEWRQYNSTFILF